MLYPQLPSHRLPTLLCFLFFASSACHCNAAICQLAGSSEVAGFSKVAGQSQEPGDADALFRAGAYRQAMVAARELDALETGYNANEHWLCLLAEAQVAIGQYSDALVTHQTALEKFPNSIRHRWQGITIYRFNDDEKKALQLRSEIADLIDRSPWRYRSRDNQLVIAEFLLSQNTDAKQVLTQFLKPVQQANPQWSEVYLKIGQVGLSKGDFALAAENFRRAAEFAPNDPAAFFGLAQAFAPSDSEQATQALRQALELNPHHSDSLLMVADQQISSEAYAAAELTLDQIIQTHPHHPIAWAYRAVLAYLDNRLPDSIQARMMALAHWPGNPAVDHTIGRELSEKYRFAEGSQYQRRALVYDSRFTPAKMQLAHDLLRLGQEMEGWKLAEQVFDADQYSVVAHNLLTLRDNLSDFATLQSGGFIVRMDRREAHLYGEQVLELLAAADQALVQKYQVELQTPIFIEIFPRQQDFAIRTFGLPGGAGFLGVCFGRVITMNSPAAQGPDKTSWKSVLWHEFCHVVTLQKTENRMPRWLSEGISVYEERLADSAWGQSINPTFRRFILEELTPVSELSGAFLNPASPQHLQFAYFESSLVVEYLVQKFGFEKLLLILDELQVGLTINDAISRHAAPIEFIDRDFKKYATDLAKRFAPQADWTPPEFIGTTAADASVSDWESFNREHPHNIAGLIGEARVRMAGEDEAGAIVCLQQALDVAPESAMEARRLLAQCFRKLGRTEQELATLTEITRRDSDSPEVLVRLLELTQASGDWGQNREFAERYLSLNPLVPLGYRYLAEIANAAGDPNLAVRALGALAELEPVDPADIRYRLALAQTELGLTDSARRNVLIALENAPRYAAAHRLLAHLAPLEQTPAAAAKMVTGEKAEAGGVPAIPTRDQPPQPDM